MKLKGINPIEQHVEKIVLGVVFLVLLGVVTMQFLYQPNKIDVGGGRTVPPDQVYEPLKQQAATLQAQISEPDPQLPEVGQIDLAEAYERAAQNGLNAPTRLATTLATPSDAGPIIGDVAAGVDTDSPIALPAVPAPQNAVAVASWRTIDPYAAAELPGLVDAVRAQGGDATGPLDLASVTVQASFSGAELRDALLSTPEGSRAIPRSYWQGAVEILRVEVERQQQQPDGSWTSAEPARGLPKPAATTDTTTTGRGGQDSAADPLDRVTSGMELADLLTVVRDVAREPEPVRTPEFAPVIAGGAWLPPAKALEQRQLLSRADEAADLRRRIEEAEATIEELRGRPRGTSRTPRDRNTGGGSGRTPGGRPSPQTTQPSTNTNNDRLERRIERLEEQIEEWRTQLEELGYDEDGQLRDPRDDDRTRTATRRDDASLLNSESVDVWGHDIGVEPGATYRYRTRVVVNNPMYGRTSSVDTEDADQRAITTTPTLSGSWSDWSEPVVVPARTLFVVESASTGSDSGLAGTGVGTAAAVGVEVYHMYYGHYRVQRVRLNPGVQIAATVTLPEWLYAVDAATAERPEVQRFFDELRRQREDAERTANRTDPNDDTTGRPTRPTSRNLADDASVPPKGVIAGPAALDVATGTLVLDVAQAPVAEAEGLSTSPPTEVVLADEFGRIDIRRADAQADAVVRLARASAREGETALPDFSGEFGGRATPGGGRYQPDRGPGRPGGGKSPIRDRGP